MGRHTDPMPRSEVGLFVDGLGVYYGQSAEYECWEA